LPDLTQSPEEYDPVKLVNDCEALGRKHMAPYYALWREALDAYAAKGYVDDRESINIKVNRLMAAAKHNVPRDASALWPKRPYFPIRAKKKDFASLARWKTQVIDNQADRGKFFEHGTAALYTAEICGAAYIQPIWDVYIESITDIETKRDPLTGQVVEIGQSKRKELKDGLAFKLRDPWDVVVHPSGNNLDEKPWVIVKDILQVSEVERLIQIGRWKLKDNVKPSDLKTGPANPDYSASMPVWRNNLSLMGGDLHRDVGVIQWLYSEGRWITTWNYHILLEDTENQSNMIARKKPLAMMRMNPGVGPDRFFGHGLWEDIRDIAQLDDDTLSIFFDNLLMQTARWFLYDRTHVDPEDLTATHGALIEVKNAGMLDGGFDKAVKVLDSPDIGRGLLEMHGLFGEVLDNREKINDVARGIAPSPRQTKGATQILAEASGTYLGFQARYLEATFMTELAYLVAKLCSDKMSPIQMVDEGGITWEQAMAIRTPDPDGIPGGFDYAFEGSDRVARRAEKHEKLIEVYNLVGNNPAIANGPGATILIKKLIESSEVCDEDELNAMQLDVTHEQSMQQQMPPGEVQSVGKQGAIMPPGEVGTPAVNVQQGGM